MVDPSKGVYIIREPGSAFPRFTLAESGYRRDKKGFFVLGGFAVGNNNGVVLAPSLFLREICENRLSRKSGRSWGTDIKQWVRFVEVVQVKKRVPPYSIDLMSVDETTFKRYGDFLTRIARSSSGQRLSTSTVRNKMMRVCIMYQWFSDNRWYHGDLGPRAKDVGGRLRLQPRGMLAHIHKGYHPAPGRAPMGSRLALSIEARRAQVLPRALSERDQGAAEKALKRRLASVPANSPRYDQYLRDELIFNIGRFVGLRVVNIAELSVAKILALRLDDKGSSHSLTLPLVGKGHRLIRPSFPVPLLRQMQTYAETARERAVKRSGVRHSRELFVAHVGSRTGRPIGVRAIQGAMEELFIKAGLTKLVLSRGVGGDPIKDEANRPTYHAVAKFSVHDLRHTCAIRTYYGVYQVTRDRFQALSRAQDQLCHADIATTEKTYAELTRRFSSWKTFCEGIDYERDAFTDAEWDDNFVELFE